MRVSPEAELSAGDQKWDEAQGFNELSSNTLWGKGEAEQDWGGGEAAGVHEPGFCQGLGGTNPTGIADLASSWEKDPEAPCESCLGTADGEPQTWWQQWLWCHATDLAE